MHGTLVNLTCGLEGVPKPTISWYFQKLGLKIQQSLTDTTHIIEYTNSTNFSELQPDRWTINSTKFSDSGTYTCEAHNTLGLTVKTFQLIVSGPPIFVGADEYSLLSRTEGSLAEIKCEVEAFPPVNITWNFNFLPISMDKITMAKNGSLV
jgi:Immunoglobulin I-set domain